MIKLVSERLIIRPFASTDVENFESVLCDDEVMEYSDDGPLSKADASIWVSKQIEGYTICAKLGRWAIAIPGNIAAIGYVGLTQQKGRTSRGVSELGFRLARKYWGKGYAFEAAQTVVKYAFENTETQRVVAIVDPHNLPSVQVLEKLGMSFREMIMFEGYDYPDKLYALEKPLA